MKQQFNNLGEDEKDKWRRAAESSKTSVNTKKKNEPEKWTLVKPADVGSHAPRSTALSKQRLHPELQPPAILNACLRLPGSQILKQHTGSVGDFLRYLQSRFLQTSTSSELNPYPVGEADVLTAVLALKCRKIHLQDAVKHLAKTCEATAGPKDGDVFPRVVPYQRCCQGVCLNSGFERVRLQSKIIEALNTAAASKYKSPSEMVKDDLLLSFEVQRCGKKCEKEFFFVSAVGFRGGVQKPTQSYVKLCPSKSFEVDRLLSLTPATHVPSIRDSKWPSPIHRAYDACSGAIQSLSTVQLSAHLVNMSDACAFPSPGDVITVQVQRWLYEDISRSTVKIGQSEDWLRIDSSATPVYAKTAPAAHEERPPPSIDYQDFFSEELGGNSVGRRSGKGSSAQDLPSAQDQQDSHDLVLGQLMDALGLHSEELSEAAELGQPKPKWQRDLEGVVDPEKLAVLKEAEQFLTAEKTDSSETWMWFDLNLRLTIFSATVLQSLTFAAARK